MNNKGIIVMETCTVLIHSLKCYTGKKKIVIQNHIDMYMFYGWGTH